MDTLLTFENSCAAYQNSYVPNDWTPKDPRKIWHIIYDVPQGQIGAVAALAASRNIGLIEITDDIQANPYDNLPNDAYMKAVIAAVSGGNTIINTGFEQNGDTVVYKADILIPYAFVRLFIGIDQ
ncbi:hypothetical protein BJX70DRAFT_172258 [Aspergillus crustosus]